MSVLRGVRSIFVVLAAVLALGTLTSVAPAIAAGESSVVIHARLCPDRTLTDLFVDCHAFPAPEGTAFRLGGRTSKFVNVRGNIAFNKVLPGSYVIALTAGQQPGNMFDLKAVCSDQNGGGQSIKMRVRETAQASFRLTVGSGQRIICDVYWVLQ
jgi:hypothetical protein